MQKSGETDSDGLQRRMGWTAFGQPPNCLPGFVAAANVLFCICLPGIEPHGNMVKQPAIFTVDTISAGQGDLMVFIEDPEGNREEVCTLSVLYGKVRLV